MVMSMKKRIRQALSRRLPVTELNIIAALLDPSQRNLTVVQDVLVAQETTAFHLLSQAMDKYTGGLRASNNASGMNEAASSSESAQSPVPWKKAKQELLSDSLLLPHSFRLHYYSLAVHRYIYPLPKTVSEKLFFLVRLRNLERRSSYVGMDQATLQ